MSAFRYEAARPDGAMVRGVLEAGSGGEAAALLSTRGLFPVAVEPVPAPGWTRWRPSARAQATVFHSLASLVGAGVPLEKALRVTERIAPGRLRDALERVAKQVREGASLGAALGAEDGVFSGVTVGLVRTGDRGIGLAPALDHAAAQLEREAETVARLRSALAYPLLLAAVGTLSVAVIVVFVVPRFVSLFEGVGQALPFATRLLIGASAAAHRYGLVFGAFVAMGIVVGTRVLREQRVAWHTWLLGLPFVGPIRHALATARAARTLGALLETGTPALTALAITRDAAGDAAVDDRLARTRDQVAEGAPLSAALASTGALTETVLQLVAIGEGSGRLPALLVKGAELEEGEAERRLRMLVTFVEPALILMFAGLVAFVAAALLQAVYSLRPGGV
ncbi:MAG: type II secretion system F family protein [Gemmatimonadales bacterium]